MDFETMELIGLVTSPCCDNNIIIIIVAQNVFEFFFKILTNLKFKLWESRSLTERMKNLRNVDKDLP